MNDGKPFNTEPASTTTSHPDHTRAAGVNAAQPNAARVYDFLLDGKDNYAADRMAAAELEKASPNVRRAVWENRDFLGRVVRTLSEAGVEQFLDIGSGLPTRDNVHEAAQRVNPDARVVYVDNDPVVLSHGRALLAGPGVAMVEGDLREPDAILDSADAHGLLRPDRPTGLILVAVAHFVERDDLLSEVLGRFAERLGRGSVVAISHACDEDMSPEASKAAREIYEASATPIFPRTRERVAALLAPHVPELHPPGLVDVAEWRPTLGPLPRKHVAGEGFFLGGLGTFEWIRR
ncbi:SAM-dependent methyltransferase [Spongiactinospora sp. TRM90649]|uniref:SAM-dependent methyltransferase n=1 Tax=Spongiactinospora sp. TRM90649 TaxID=3031114 RepID=UPI0023F8FC97|nr:SAM-dependent methyltransferase [Spongiactinospora sp. TRM90649]MDF5758407.1 SAM-dependent methyltransferase [Spongiactinospora sp. TRM90649]